MRYLSIRNNIAAQVMLYFTACLDITVGLDSSRCSCYTFYDDSRSWENSRSLCKSSGGDLVSIETLHEWEFITKQTKNHSTETAANQWWIGLQRQNLQWVWISNSSLTYESKWVYIKLNEREEIKYNLAVIEKDTGQYWKTRNSLKSGTICEYKTQACTINQTQWCDEEYSTTTGQPLPPTTTPLTTTMTTIATTAATISTERKTTRAVHVERSSAKNNLTTTRSHEGSNDKRSVGKQKKPFPIVVFMVVLAVMLLLCIGVLIVLWIYKTRKRGKHRLSHRRYKPETKLEVKFDVKNMYDRYSENSSGQYESISPQEKHTNSIVHTNEHRTNTEIKVAKKENKVSQVSDDFLSETKYEEIDEQPNTNDEQKHEVEIKPEKKADKVKPSADLGTFGNSQDNDDDDVFYTSNEENIVTGNPPNESSSEVFTYAGISASGNKKPSDVLYDEVDEKVSEKDDKEVTYAEIFDFNANGDLPVKKPTPYSRTEYASVTLHPLSPRKSDT